jgi:hypothetical protein
MLQQLYFASDNVGAKNSAKLSYQWAVWRSQMPKAPPVLPVLPGALCSLSAETSHSLMVSRRQAGPSAPTRQPEHAGPRRRRPSLTVTEITAPRHQSHVPFREEGVSSRLSPPCTACRPRPGIVAAAASAEAGEVDTAGLPAGRQASPPCSDPQRTQRRPRP